MVNYRRATVPGATYFFTVTLRDRHSRLLTEQITAFREALKTTKRSQPFRIDAMAVLPDHVHTIWTLPPDDHDYSGRWRAIKAGFTRAVQARGVSVRRNRRGEYDVWQRRFWEHLIRDGTDFTRHVDYIHFNPVKHGLAQRPVDWPLVLPAQIHPAGHCSARLGRRRGRRAVRRVMGIPDSAALHPGYDFYNFSRWGRQ